MSPARAPVKRSLPAKPSLRLERELIRAQRLVVAGMDEVGRGALAGPVTVGVVAVTVTTRSAPYVGARVVVEASNDSSTVEADAILESKGVFVVPDMVANAGGLVASYFEWTQNRAGYRWTTNLLNERLGDIVRACFRDVLALSRVRRVPMRTAAYMLAIGRVATVQQLRGIHA